MKRSVSTTTRTGVVTNLNGMDWKFVNVRTSDNGHKLAHVPRDSAVRPPSPPSWKVCPLLKALAPFLCITRITGPQVGSFVSRLKYALKMEKRVPAGNAHSMWTAMMTCRSTFSVDVQTGPCFRLITTAQFGQIANVDDIRIRNSVTLPRLAWPARRTLRLGGKHRGCSSGECKFIARMGLCVNAE